MLALIAQLLHTVLMLAVAPLLVGLRRRAAARLVGRAGPTLAQPWRDLFRLARKQPVIASGTSRLFLAAPAVAFAASLTAAALVPSFTLGMITAPLADLFVFIGLLGVGRCVVALAAMDTGTALGGLGASRSVTLAALAEPTVLLVIFAVSQLVGGTNLDTAVTLLRANAHGWPSELAGALLATGIVAVTETGQGSAADVIGAATTQEYAGRHLALLDWGAALRLEAWLGLIAVLFIPFGMADTKAPPLAWLIGLLAWIIKIGALVLALAVLEVMANRMRVERQERALGLALLLALLAAILLFAGQGAA